MLQPFLAAQPPMALYVKLNGKDLMSYENEPCQHQLPMQQLLLRLRHLDTAQIQ
jgi:hypothetical protein